MEKKDRGLMTTGSHVIWKGKPLASVKKGSWAQGEVKPRRKRGLKVQSPILGTGVTLGVKTTQNKRNHILLVCFTITFPLSSYLISVPLSSFEYSLMMILLGAFTGSHRVLKVPLSIP